MSTTAETPDQLLERLDVMGLERVKTLQAKNHFEPKARGLVQGWIQRAEEALKPPPEPVEEEAQKPDPVLQEALRAARKAAADAKAARDAAVAARQLALIAIGFGGAALVVAILGLLASTLG